MQEYHQIVDEERKGKEKTPTSVSAPLSDNLLSMTTSASRTKC